MTPRLFGPWRTVVVIVHPSGREHRATVQRWVSKRSAVAVARVVGPDRVTLDRKRCVAYGYTTPEPPNGGAGMKREEVVRDLDGARN